MIDYYIILIILIIIIHTRIRSYIHICDSIIYIYIWFLTHSHTESRVKRTRT